MKHLSDYVNPYIGTISHMLTSTKPEVMLPYGMARSFPVANDNGDSYCNDRVLGFPLGAAYVMPGKGGSFHNILDHSRETARCYYNRLELEEHGIVAETTVTQHVFLHRFSGQDCLRLTFPGGSAQVEGNTLRITLPWANRGRASLQEYVYVQLGEGVAVTGQEEEVLILSAPSRTEVRGAMSLISLESAQKSFEAEAAGRDFEAIQAQAQKIWDDQLGKFIVEGNTEDRKTVFYTALYRAFQRMTDLTEHGQYFSGFDGKVHAGVFYSNDGLWDTFRCMHPLQLLVDERRHKDILASYVEMYKQSGLMPCFPGIEGDLPVMIGFHAASLFADAMAKGVEADYETAYEGIRKNAMEQSMMPWACNAPAGPEEECYWEKGFFPALKKGETETCPAAHPFERRQSVAVTLEHCYDDWCAGQMAEKLGKAGDAALFAQRAQGYKSLYNPELGWMAPKSIDGQWVEDFNPKFAGGMGGRDYTTENNTWTYTWSVLHDPEGLAELMGGKEQAGERLDQLFREGFHNEPSKFIYLGQFPDSTGLMGQFAMGNEPSFHIPYLYDYFGQPWKAQKKLRDLMDVWFTNSPTGICGDEDGGAMSSWLVFSAMGFYPVCPGKAEYALGTPLFDSMEMKMEHGAAFKVTAKGAGEGLRYIQSATLNGQKLDRPFLTHEQITAGGELKLEMGSKPVK